MNAQATGLARHKKNTNLSFHCSVKYTSGPDLANYYLGITKLVHRKYLKYFYVSYVSIILSRFSTFLYQKLKIKKLLVEQHKVIIFANAMLYQLGNRISRFW